MSTPEQPSIPVRPRRRRPTAAAPPAETNGIHPPEEPLDFSTPDDLRRLTRAIEELHASTRAMQLPPIRVEWEPGQEDASRIDPEKLALQAHATDLLADYEGYVAGPIPDVVADIRAPADPDAWMIEGFCRPGTLVMVAGSAGVAKSWIIRQLAISGSTGQDLFLDRYPITRRLNVLVVDEDNGANEEWRRDEKLLAFLDLPRDRLGSYRRISLAGVLLDQEAWQRWLRGAIRTWDIDLVILDPISEMYAGKELREDPAFRSVLSFLKKLKVDFPATTTVAVHHTRKRDAKDKGPAGLEELRGQWGQTPDVVAMVSSLADRRSRWEIFKRAPHSMLYLEQAESGGMTTVADSSTAVDMRMATDHKVLAAIDAGASTVKEIQLASGLSSSGTYKTLERLHGAGLITRRPPYERLVDPTDDPLEES
ncbi:MAG TPA: AAA family ATPase [Candidatus Limnocylindrales bacterium]|nr:AAA family ATPase [Candidatus Limnocylindrales bacterium]